MWKKSVNTTRHQAFSCINVTLEELIDLRNTVVHNTTPITKKLRACSAGQHVVKIRGRGIEFDTTREYQPGDDIRCMAWRVTARSLKPHIKIYHEERERPVWLAVDLSPSLYFGTRCMFKSVKIIKKAVLLGWSHLHNHERIGAFIATPHKMLSYSPKLREREFLLILKSLVQTSAISPTFTENNCLHHLLVTMQQQVRSGNLIYILSDFLHFDITHKKMILHFAQRAQVKLIFVYDPFEAAPPPVGQYVLTDGKNISVFPMNESQNREYYRQQFQDKINDLKDFSHKHSLSLEILCTDQEKEVFARHEF